MTVKDFKIGQEVYIAYYDSRNKSSNRYIPISKTGNKWITLANDYRFNPEDMCIDGGEYSSPAKVYLSIDEYNEYEKRISLIRTLRNSLDYSRTISESVTSEDIIKAMELLKIKAEDAK